MEPVSVAALVGSGLAVVTKSIKNLKDLSDKNKNVEQSTQLLIAKLSTLRAAFSQLQIYLDNEGTHRLITPQLQSDLESAIQPCNTLIHVIDQHVCKIQAGWLHGKLRYLWDESIIKEHGVHLDSQISALNLLLQVIQLSSANEQRSILERHKSRRILQRARDDASSFLSSSSFRRSSSPRPVFDYESQLMNSNVYNATVGRWDRHRKSVPATMTTTQSSPSSLPASEHVPPNDDDDLRIPEKQMPPSIRVATAWYQKKLCGKVPMSVAAIMVAVLLIAAVIVGAAVGTFEAKEKSKSSRVRPGGNRDDSSPISTGSALLFDATPIPTPSDLPPIPSGKFVLPSGTAEESSPGCLTVSNQLSAWSCKTIMPLSISINNTSDGLRASMGSYATSSAGIQYGVQLPSMVAPMQLVLDQDKIANGPAYHFSARYDRVVVLGEDEFAAEGSRRKRQTYEPTSQVRPGDSPWYCYWNQTFIEGYVYVEVNSSAATLAASTSAWPLPTETSAVSVETSTPTIAGESAPADTSDFPRLPPYPRNIKIEERHLPDAPQPYCQKMRLLDNGQVFPATNDGAEEIRVYLQVDDPSPTPSTTNAAKRNMHAVKKREDPPNACHCQWTFK